MGGVFILGISPDCSSLPAPVRKKGFESELRALLGPACMTQPTCQQGPWLRMPRGQQGHLGLRHTLPVGTHLTPRGPDVLSFWSSGG